MKKFLVISGLSLMTTVSAIAQQSTLNGLPILEDAYMTKITRNGNIITGFTTDDSAISFNIETSKGNYYFGCTVGKGYPAADNGLIVGADMENSGIAVFLNDGYVINIPVLKDNYIMSDLHSITPDASRACGVAGQGISTDEANFMYRPIVCDIDENGTVAAPVMLPFPEVDFFGKKPQFCSAVWMSSDGKTIVGQVIENTGMLNTYPIVYTEDENGEWEYSLPSKSLFNPENLPLPKYPGEFEDVYPGLEAPQYTDYMTPDELKRFNDALEAWIEEGSPEGEDPYEHLSWFMTPEEILAFNEAADIYNECAMTYNEILETYWLDMFRIADSSVLFLRNAMTLSADGKKMAMTAVYVKDDGKGDIYEEYVPWIFDLENGSCYKTETQGINLISNHILADGTLVASNMPSDINPAKGYVCLPGTSEFIPVQDYIETMNPYVANWMNENLTGDVIVGIEDNGKYITREMTVTGCFSASDNWEVISSGVDGYTLDKNMYFTYYVDNLTSDVKQNSIDKNPEIYEVWNLQGLRIMKTTEKNDLKSLPKGIYIINGKKVAI